MDKLLIVEIVLESGEHRELEIDNEMLGQYINEKVREIKDTELIDDKAILVERTCSECGTISPVALRRTEKDTKMLCHPCGHFQPVVLREHEKYFN